MKAIDMACEESVKKWTLWCFNYPTPFESTICKIWGGKLSGFGGRYYCEDNYFTQHIIETWQKFEHRGDARMMFFYCELDTENKTHWVDVFRAEKRYRQLKAKLPSMKAEFLNMEVISDNIL